MAQFRLFYSRPTWFPLILAVTLTILSNMIIISCLLVSKRRHTTINPSPSRVDILHASVRKSPAQIMKPKLALPQLLKWQAVTATESPELITEKLRDMPGKHPQTRTGVFSNQTLPLHLRAGLLQPGTMDEAVAKKLMTVRRYQIVNPHDYDYRINPVNVCKDKEVEVVLCVVTAVKNMNVRSQFRYAIKGGYAGIWNEANKAVLLFFVGLPSGPTSGSLQAKVNNESLTFDDIVQSTFIDTYRNLSIKTVSILKWVSQYCGHAKFVIKTDDDCDVNIPLMITELHKMQHERPLFILGKVSRKLTPVRIQHSKWYIPLSVYKEDKYPTFMYGGSQGYPTQVAGLLYEASLRIPTFWLEDVYISGLCADMLNIPRLDNRAFYFSHIPPPGETEY